LTSRRREVDLDDADPVRAEDVDGEDDIALVVDGDDADVDEDADIDEEGSEEDAGEDDDALTALDDDESEQASLDELLAQRAAARRGSDDPDDEVELITAYVPEPVHTVDRPAEVAIRDRQEFVCNSCHLVKPRVQLADARRGLCRDCA
jgi:hypothetical protein